MEFVVFEISFTERLTHTRPGGRCLGSREAEKKSSKLGALGDFV
jgi:hypothetical protein